MDSSNKAIYLVAVLIGSIVGGYLPVLFGASIFSSWSILTSAIVALIFVLLAAKIFR